MGSYCFPDALYASTASAHLTYAEYASPRDSGFVSRTSVISASPLQRKFVMNGSASLESSPVFRHSAAANFMTPQPHHRIMGHSNVRYILFEMASMPFPCNGLSFVVLI